ncbi:hypothetical protein GKZ89_14080 [Bacillus mangrovi]|uniref:DUF304 domain-containing protein n=1 Tax=Metabacillus mangrovi TaxID=1491830 RepID=A0A7X2S6F4_9BACI|nr:DUF5381 family protein [Metabacillus mangrovi]MTH54529.1 hypothetical protein [Metabacillus mangrovi]
MNTTLLQNRPIKIKMNPFFFVWLFMVTVGGIALSIFLIGYGFQFKSSYSLISIFVGIVTLPFSMLTTILWVPSFFKRGTTLYKIYEGENGYITDGKRQVAFKDIQDIRLNLYRPSLQGLFYQELIVSTFDNRVVRFHTFNTLKPLDVKQHIEKYVIPYMHPHAQEAWFRKFTNGRIQP